jgi:hypothetical protein
VANLLDRRLVAGPHHVFWEGLNTRGERVASGVYFYRLAAEGMPILTKKMVLIK